MNRWHIFETAYKLAYYSVVFNYIIIIFCWQLKFIALNKFMVLYHSANVFVKVNTTETTVAQLSQLNLRVKSLNSI